MEVLAQYPTHHTATVNDWKSQLTLSTPTTRGSLKPLVTYKFKAPTTNRTQLYRNTNIYNIFNNYKKIQLNGSTCGSSNKFNCDKQLIKTKTTPTTARNLKAQTEEAKVTLAEAKGVQNEVKITNQAKTQDTLKATAAAKASETAKFRIVNKTTGLLWQSLYSPSVQELAIRLLEELRAAKSRHLVCTEVSLPCDLTARIALAILELANVETNGLRDGTIYIEFEDEPYNSRRIATIDFNRQRSNGAYEIYVTLRQDHRGWISFLPQFMKSLSRTVTISPHFNITKHKPYSSNFY